MRLALLLLALSTSVMAFERFEIKDLNLNGYKKEGAWAIYVRDEVPVETKFQIHFCPATASDLIKLTHDKDFISIMRCFNHRIVSSVDNYYLIMFDPKLKYKCITIYASDDLDVFEAYRLVNEFIANSKIEFNQDKQAKFANLPAEMAGLIKWLADYHGL